MMGWCRRSQRRKFFRRFSLHITELSTLLVMPSESSVSVAFLVHPPCLLSFHRRCYETRLMYLNFEFSFRFSKFLFSAYWAIQIRTIGSLALILSKNTKSLKNFPSWVCVTLISSSCSSFFSSWRLFSPSFALGTTTHSKMVGCTTLTLVWVSLLASPQPIREPVSMFLVFSSKDKDY